MLFLIYLIWFCVAFARNRVVALVVAWTAGFNKSHLEQSCCRSIVELRCSLFNVSVHFRHCPFSYYYLFAFEYVHIQRCKRCSAQHQTAPNGASTLHLSVWHDFGLACKYRSVGASVAAHKCTLYQHRHVYLFGTTLVSPGRCHGGAAAHKCKMHQHRDIYLFRITSVGKSNGPRCWCKRCGAQVQN